MSKDVIEKIDEMLLEALPKNPQHEPEKVSDAQKQELIKLLQHAAEEIGRSPSRNEFNSLDLGLSASKIGKVFGSWNEGKREAGLETYEIGEKAERYLNEEYFKTIDTIAKAYWLGTVFATSSISSNREHGPVLVIARSNKKDYFVIEFANAIESKYSIQSYQNPKSGSLRATLQISDGKFIESILDLGYEHSDGSEVRLPNLADDLRAPFVRGYLESSRRDFTGNPMRISTDNQAVAETLKNWLKDFGVNHPSVTKRKSDGVGVNISNEFNIKALFEALWPDGVATEPSYTPYPESILNYLKEEYPYPENVEYLSE